MAASREPDHFEPREAAIDQGSVAEHVKKTAETEHVPATCIAGEHAIATTCIEHQAGRPTLRLSFQIKVF